MTYSWPSMSLHAILLSQKLICEFSRAKEAAAAMATGKRPSHLQTPVKQDGCQF